jgi:hypothetical protein
MIRYGLQWQALQDYFAIEESTIIASLGEGGAGVPPDNHVWIYAKDKSSTSALYWRNDAGTEFDLSTMVGGSGASGRVAFWSGTSTLSSNAAFLWDNTNKRLGVNVSSNTLSFEVECESSTDGPQYTRYGSGGGALWTMRGATNTQASPGQVSADLLLGGIGGQGRDNAGNWSANVAVIAFKAREAFTSSARGTYITFEPTRVATTTRAEAMRLIWDTTSAGFPILLIGRTTPTSNTNACIDISGNGAVSGGGQVNLYAFGSAVAANFRGLHARGTPAGPTASSTDDPMAALSALGYDGSAYVGRQAGILLCAGSLWSGSNRETYIRFDTTANASTTNTERFRMGPSGQFGIGGATYGTAGNFFRSGGASAAPTWAFPDHGAELGGLTDDDHTQYALLAGRSGGQTLIGGTAAADDLILRATSGVGVGSEQIRFQLGSNGAREVMTLTKTDGGTMTVLFDSAEASKQVNMNFADNGTTKWIIYKKTSNDLAVWDAVANQDMMAFTATAGVAGGAAVAVKVAPTIANTGGTAVGFSCSPIFTGGGAGPWGGSIAAVFRPSSSVGACYNSLNNPSFGPPSGVTITGAFGAYYGLNYENTSGAVTNGYSLWINSPTIAGALKPTTHYGILVADQGGSGITNSIGISVSNVSGSTNNWLMEFPGDATDPTGGGGAATGRIKILVGGVTRYLAYY